VSETVLIVDDHGAFRRFARRLLEAGGLTVVGEAGDSESAVAAARELDPDLVLLDVLLPDGEGFAVAERIARDNARTRVVLTSSRERDDLQQRLTGTPARGFIPKDELTVERFIAVARDGR
jgi:two-component system nitrate/nitrite response regulator NarL